MRGPIEPSGGLGAGLRGDIRGARGTPCAFTGTCTTDGSPPRDLSKRPLHPRPTVVGHAVALRSRRRAGVVHGAGPSRGRFARFDHAAAALGAAFLLLPQFVVFASIRRCTRDTYPAGLFPVVAAAAASGRSGRTGAAWRSALSTISSIVLSSVAVQAAPDTAPPARGTLRPARIPRSLGEIVAAKVEHPHCAVVLCAAGGADSRSHTSRYDDTSRAASFMTNVRSCASSSRPRISRRCTKGSKLNFSALSIEVGGVSNTLAALPAEAECIGVYFRDGLMRMSASVRIDPN